MLAVAYAICWAAATFLFADLQRWRQYYSTMLYSSLANALYILLCYQYPLWQLEPHGLANQTLTDLLFILVCMPLSTFVYLSKYPAGRSYMRQILYLALFVGIFVIKEVLFIRFKAISYYNGWNLLWSIGFDLVMFLMLYLHFRRPLLALAVSIPIILSLMGMFHVTVDKMK